MVQALTVSLIMARSIGTGTDSYHTTEHCHIGTGCDSITQHRTATLVQALTVSLKLTRSHWYRHSSITQTEHSTLVQALTVSLKMASSHWYKH